ncbi:hypothetical protein [Streptomyces sp. enrichment culture]|uniref:hypothetical protein n=1 Tax=Streptomyces sp. enrichment culture TaxID=1795815 RepID=UPI003F56C0F9
MIRLPTTHAAITAPLVASNTEFPGVPIGRSMLDGRPFHLSPVLVPGAVLPSTNSLALGGLGSGKSTTAKVRILREIEEYGHQAVVIDSFGEDGVHGEWGPVVHALGGRVVRAGSVTLNPLSELFPRPVREQLVRSLILAVEPGALSHQAAHALQHALTHPQARTLGGLVDALVSPTEGRWPAARLAEWGEGAAIALSRYTEGSLAGLFDGPDAGLPPTDLPILSFDFTGLDRNSPAIPSLMAAVTCWAEHVWLLQSTAVHRHLVLEEAWQILLSPATAGLIQRLLKNSRRAALSLDVIMHTLSDLGDGRAQDLARLCEVAHVGRLGPEEAAAVGALLGLPQWAVGAIPTLGPGQAVWRVGPAYVDIIETVLDEEEAALTDTSSRRRRAQQAYEQPTDEDDDQEHQDQVHDEDQDQGPDEDHGGPEDGEEGPSAADGDTARAEPVPLHKPAPHREEDEPTPAPPSGLPFDARHQAVVRAAREGRHSEAAQLAAIGEREDITAHGITSDQAVAWLVTHAVLADLRGDRDQAVRLRATVTRMGKDPNSAWFEAPSSTGPAWHSGPQPPYPAPPADAAPEPAAQPPAQRRRLWPYLAAVVALVVTAGGVWQESQARQEREQREATAAAYKGKADGALTIDGVNAEVLARWTKDRRVIIALSSGFDQNARYLRIEAGDEAATSVRKNGWYPEDPEIAVPVDDSLDEVTVRVAVGGKTWKPGSEGTWRTVRLSPTGTAVDAETGKALPPA